MARLIDADALLEIYKKMDSTHVLRRTERRC